jgi:hypothetical protein
MMLPSCGSQVHGKGKKRGLTENGCHGSHETFQDYFSFQFWATATAAPNNQGHRPDFTCKQQQLGKKNPATQESCCSNIDYIAGLDQQEGIIGETFGEVNNNSSIDNGKNDGENGHTAGNWATGTKMSLLQWNRLASATGGSHQKECLDDIGTELVEAQKEKKESGQ